MMPRAAFQFAWRTAACAAIVIAPRSVQSAEPTATSASEAASGIEFFERRVRPILVARCHECHGSQKHKANLRLDSRDRMLAGGDTGPAIVPGKPDESLLVDAIRYGDTYQMPPKSQLPAEEIDALVEWVRIGAPWPVDSVSSGNSASSSKPSDKQFDLAARARHWCFQPLAEVDPPTVADPVWPAGRLDRFVLARLEQAGLHPAPEAEKPALLRRVTYDLIGLPPSRDEIAHFLSDQSPDAYARVIERLLASPHYGERWGRHWLDLVRFAETFGHEFDFELPNAFRYRDYVIRAFNADLPYDHFLLEHLAGDLITPPRINQAERINESILGTGFYFLGEAKHSPVDVRQDEADRVDNQIDVLAKTFLSLTVSCARCHDHKFDAITTKDYYALAGYLQSSRYQQACIDLPEVFSRSVNDLRGLACNEQEWCRRALADLAAAPDSVFEVLFSCIAEPAELEQAADDASHPLHVLARLKRQQTPEQFTAEKARLASDLAARPLSVSQQHVTIADFSRDDFAGWFITGDAFGEQPAPAGQMAFFTDGPNIRVSRLENAAAHSGMRSARLRGTLRSPTFVIEKPKILYRLYGTAGRVRLILDGLQLIQNPIYGGLQIEPRRPRAFWLAQDVSKWIGHRAYIEILDEDDGYLAVEKILQTDGSEPPSPPVSWTIELLNDSSIDSLAALQAAYHRAMRRAAQSAGEDSAAHSEYNLLLSLMLDRLPKLAPSRLATLEQFANLAGARRSVEQQVPLPRFAPAMADGNGENERVFIRGNPKNLGDEVPRRSLEVLSGAQQPAPAAGSGRLELARRLISDSSHLIARVMANRVWKHHFGQGIVPTTDDFGVMGQPPTNPELLDYLAGELIREGWSIKHLHRTILLSSTYRMSSHASPEAEAVDPTNKLLHHMPLRRLEAECIRDALLAVSGRLDATLFGPSIAPYLSEFMVGRGRPGVSGPLDGNGRRSIYLNVRRNFLTPMLLAFDYPTPFTTIGRRSVSNVPAQGLTLLNNPFVREQAQRWGQRMSEASSYSNDTERVMAMYEMAFGRLPEPSEQTAALAFLAERRRQHPGAQSWEPLAELGHVLFNVKEFIFVN